MAETATKTRVDTENLRDINELLQDAENLLSELLGEVGKEVVALEDFWMLDGFTRHTVAFVQQIAFTALELRSKVARFTDEELKFVAAVGFDA